MPVSQRSAARGWVVGALFVVVAGGGLLIAQEQGWLPSLPWFRLAASDRPSPARDELDDEVPGPDEADDGELPASALLAQSEPEEMTPETPLEEGARGRQRGAARHSQWSSAESPALELDDAADDLPPARSRSNIVRAGFEEEAPPAPSDPEEARDRERTSSRGGKPAVAARPGDTAEAVSTLRSTQSNPAKGAPLMDRKKIEELMDEGDYVEAQKELSRWYWQMPNEHEKILPQLNKMAQALYFSPQPMYFEPYVVKPGDQLRVVGQRYKLSWEYIAKLNHADARKIRMGQKLKIVPGPFAAVVFLDRYELVVHLNGSFVKSYRVGVGKDGTTPVGTFIVKNKMVDPTYYGPEGVIAHDDPNNPLGERWIDIGDSYGIHGTIDPQSIGKNESRGCIRMLNPDVEEVYDFLVMGSEVRIQK
ncbi:MAG: L,D-transpeptidase family protein [Deltaproteobacteria bacterium]